MSRCVHSAVSHLSVAAALCMLAASASAASPDIRLSVRPIFGDRAKAPGILPLRVDIQARAPFQGRLVAFVKTIPDTIVTVPLNIGPGSFRYDIPVQVSQIPSGPEVVVTLRDRAGRTVDGRVLSETFYSDRQVQAGLASSAGLTKALVAWVGAGVTPAVYRQVGSWMSLADAANLPADPRLYDAVDVVVLPAAIAPRLSQNQVDALVRWVAGGGRLVTDTACTDLEAKANPILDRFGIVLSRDTGRVNFQQQVSYFHAYRQLTNAIANLSLQVRQAAVGTESCDGDRLVVRTRHGLGFVAVTCADLRQCLSENTADAFGAFLGSTILGEPRPAAEDWDNANMGSFYYDSYMGIFWSPWVRVLMGMNAVEPIPRWLIVCYLVVFAIVVCPVMRLVLGRAGKLRWVWVATTLVVLVFCLSADLLSTLARGRTARRSTICIHDYAAGKGGRHSSLESFVPSRSRSVVLSAGPADTVLDLSMQEAGATASLDLAKNELEFSSPVWSPHYFMTSRMHEETAPFETDLTIRGSVPTGRVRVAAAGTKVEEAWIMWDGKLYSAVAGEGGSFTLAGTGDAVALPRNTDWMWNAKSEELLAILRDYVALSSGGTGTSRRTLEPFDPAPVHGLVLDDKVAVLIARLSGGPVMKVSEAKTKDKAFHFVRQVVKVKN